MANTEMAEHGQNLVAFLTGDIDHHGAKKAREMIDAAVSVCRPEKLILDFSEVEFIDSSAVGLIMGRYRLMSQLGGTVKVINLNARCKKLLQLSGVFSIVTCEERKK